MDPLHIGGEGYRRELKDTEVRMNTRQPADFAGTMDPLHIGEEGYRRELKDTEVRMKTLSQRS